VKGFAAAVEGAHKSIPSNSLSDPSMPVNPPHSTLLSPKPSTAVSGHVERAPSATVSGHVERTPSAALSKHAERKDCKWPFDFYICEISYGLLTIRDLIDKNPRKTWKDLVPEIFKTKYVKTTFIKY
jgi:hypothetical protein